MSKILQHKNFIYLFLFRKYFLFTIIRAFFNPSVLKTSKVFNAVHSVYIETSVIFIHIYMKLYYFSKIILIFVEEVIKKCFVLNKTRGESAKKIDPA